MKKKISFLLVMILIMSFIFAACGSDLPFRDDDGPAIVNRYEANSYTGEDKIKYMYTYGDEDEEGHYKEYDFYYIYLGELTNIPLFYKASSYH